ncbi:tryptophan synthase subunit alpha [Sedimenticola hydrogenitrophicus]|uniref:tryptophan synthase subunit alpha n=1 Tax=Sedimenticola hydrogenitrophicus TaxID=2967975 RepID=UPI0023B1D40C|nr:tryptophan synthase subunit alpha [Sedimenticola hydrogenitrophicus]
MSRISDRFKQLEERGRVALIPFVTAGDPGPAVTVPLMHTMVEAGADIIELGVPFSDPMADGPVIQRASERALEQGVCLRDVLGMVRKFRERDEATPVVLMGYLNPIEVMGYEAFALAAAEAGVDGVLTVDLPPEEADDLLSSLRPRNIDPIFLMAPTTTDERMQHICDTASGFVYYVSVKGITGAGHLAVGDVAAKTAQIRKHTRLPVGVGFGIKDANTAQAVAQVADAVIVGSVLVQRIEELRETPDEIAPAIAMILSSMRQAIDLI